MTKDKTTKYYWAIHFIYEDKIKSILFFDTIENMFKHFMLYIKVKELRQGIYDMRLQPLMDHTFPENWKNMNEEERVELLKEKLKYEKERRKWE